MSGKVAILHHGYIPHYRAPFYEMLARRGRADYVVFHGDPPSWIGNAPAEPPFNFPQRWVKNFEFRIGPGTAVYQPAVREVLTGGYDAIVLSAEVKFVSNVLLAMLAPWRGTAVLYWGFGYHPQRGFRDSDTPQRGFFAGVNALKNALTRAADGYLAYTKTGVERLAEIGYPRDRVFVMRNTIDVTEQCRLYDQVRGEDDRQIRGELGLRPDSVVLTHIGRLVQFKRVDQLIEAARLIRDRGLAQRPVEFLIIGAGPLEVELKAQAAGIPGIHFLGGLPPDERIARCLKVSAAVTIAGAIGLVVNHAFAHGCPVITPAHDAHGAEIEYVEHDRNGLVVPGGIDQFATALGRFADDPAWQARLAHGALQAREELRIETMVEQFDNAVCATIARRRGTPEFVPTTTADLRK